LPIHERACRVDEAGGDRSAKTDKPRDQAYHCSNTQS
jgi:hypothetical protein